MMFFSVQLDFLFWLFSTVGNRFFSSKLAFSHLKMDGWNLEYDRFLLEPGLFSGVFDVSFREYKSANTLRSSCRSIATQVATLNRYQIHFIFVLDGNP